MWIFPGRPAFPDVTPGFTPGAHGPATAISRCDEKWIAGLNPAMTSVGLMSPADGTCGNSPSPLIQHHPPTAGSSGTRSTGRPRMTSVGMKLLIRAATCGDETTLLDEQFLVFSNKIQVSSSAEAKPSCRGPRVQHSRTHVDFPGPSSTCGCHPGIHSRGPSSNDLDQQSVTRNGSRTKSRDDISGFGGPLDGTWRPLQQLPHPPGPAACWVLGSALNRAQARAIADTRRSRAPL